ncbi:MAG: hypothetical protein WD009_04865 [Phycisphaeraceae bacterium]
MIELTFALAGTAIVGLGVAGMLAATTYGTTSRHDMRELLVRGMMLNERVAEAVRASRQVLASGEDYLVLWVATADAEDAPTLRGLLRIELDTEAQALLAYAADEAATDETYQPSSDFANLTRQLIDDGQLVGERWGRAVADWRIMVDDDGVAGVGRHVRWELALHAATGTYTTSAAATRRSE